MLRLSKGWARYDANIVMQTGSIRTRDGRSADLEVGPLHGRDGRHGHGPQGGKSGKHRSDLWPR